MWDLHFRIVVPAYMGMGLFDDIYKDLFEDQGAFSSYELLGGFDNKTLETNQALWDLSRKATDADVRKVLEEKANDEVVAALEGSAAGKAFLAELNAYLAEYGQRGTSWMLTSPSWIEDPTPVIKNLQDYIGQADEGDPRVRLARARRRR